MVSPVEPLAERVARDGSRDGEPFDVAQDASKGAEFLIEALVEPKGAVLWPRMYKVCEDVY